MSREVDVAVIGTGSAGMRAYRQAKKRTNSVVVIEANQYGTTCARVGCMPSKLMIAPADARHRVETFKEFGLKVGPVDVDGKAVMERVRNERDRFVGFVKMDVEDFDPNDRLLAKATFVDDHTLSLSNGETIKAKTIVIATGSRPFVPDVFKPGGDRVVTSDDVFYWQDLPQSCAVVGTGVIGVELGQALHRLGVDTVVFGRSERIGFLSDPEIASYAASVFKNEYALKLETDITKVERTDNGVRVTYHNDSEGSVTREFETLLCAAGRQPNVDELGLKNTSLALGKDGVPIHNKRSMQCQYQDGQPAAVFIAGDATDERPLLHEAADEGNFAGTNAATYPNVREFDRKTLLVVIFSDPQIAVVGQTWQQLTDQGIEFVTGMGDFEDQGRSRVMLVNKGRMHLYGCLQTGKVLGAEMIGPSHEHLAHLLAWSIQQGLTVSQMLDMPFYHPVIEEGLRDGLYDLRYKLKQAIPANV